MTANENMSRTFQVARDLIRQRAVEYPENHEIAERLWSLLLKNPDYARHLLDFILRETDRIGRIEEREAILDIHIEGKPKADEVKMSNLIEMTNGLSGAQIENLLNAVLNRDNAVFTEIKVLSGYNEEGIYDKYFTVYHM